MEGKRRVVLLVDDEESVHVTVRQALSGHEIASAYNRWQALEAFEKERPDVVLMDLNLPGASGLDVIRDMRTAGRAPPVIVLTAFPTLETARQAGRLGVGAFIEKSAEACRTLPERIASVLSGATDASFEAELERALCASRKLLPEAMDVARLATALEQEMVAQRSGPSSRALSRLGELFDRALVRLAVDRLGGNKEAAARLLGVSKQTIYNKLQKR